MRWAAPAWILLGCASTTAGTFVDGSAPPPRDASCSGQRTPARALDPDPATGCPREVVVEHRWSAPRVCERVEPSCTVPAGCRFPVRLLAPALPGCTRPGLAAVFAACRCEFGVVECASRAPTLGEWPGCVSNSMLCYDCASDAGP